MKLWVSSTFPFSFHQLVRKGDFHKLLSAELMQVGCERLTSHFIGIGLVEPLLNHHITLKLHFLKFNQAYFSLLTGCRLAVKCNIVDAPPSFNNSFIAKSALR